MLRLSFTAVGAWGQSSEVEVEISELMSTTFEDYVDLVAPESGTVLIDPGAYGFSLSGPTEVDEGQTVEFGLHLGLEALRPRIGSFRGRIHLDERVIQVDSVVQGDFGGVLEANLAPLRDSGFIRIAGVNGSPPDGDTYRVARLVGIVGGGGGDSTFISFDLEEAFSGGSFVDLTAFSEPAPPLALTVRRETVWGDPSGDEVVSSLDALVCLSFVVGKEIPPGFSGALCDVAPDGAGGFTGAVTALDALAILSYVVGKPLPDGFRLGGSA
jgi:hypothetical protein